MITRKLLATALALLAAATAFAAAAPVLPGTAQQASAAGAAHLTAFGSRGPRQSQTAATAKLDGALADLSRHMARVRAGHELTDMHAMAPAAHFKQSSPTAPPLVLIDAVTKGDPQQLKAALVALGLQGAQVFSNDVGGYLPVNQLAAAAARAEVHSIRASMMRTRTGAVTSQGDFAQRSDVLRSSNSLDGTGVTVGILSDSFNCYQTYAADNVTAGGPVGYAFNGFLADYPADESTLDLPANVNVVQEASCLDYTSDAPIELPHSDEGRAMLQIVHDVAPGAGLAFFGAPTSESGFANGILLLAQSTSNGGAGAKVIADDIGYTDEPFFQDGLIAQAIDQVEAQGVAYFSAAGNDGQNSYENTTPTFPVASTQNAGEQLLAFGTSGGTPVTNLPITIPALSPGQYIALVVEWDQPYVTGAPNSGGATSQIDLCVSGSGSDTVFDMDGNSPCTGPSPLGQDPVQIMLIGTQPNYSNPTASGNPSTSAVTVNVTIGLAGGPVPGRIKFLLSDDGAGGTINSFNTNSPTVQGHPGAAGAAAVGAAYYFMTPRCGTTAASLEPFSSLGGDPILFDSTGKAQTPTVRQKPDFVGPDGVNNTFLGGPFGPNGFYPVPTTNITQCQDNTAPGGQGVYPSFLGTSAATPHAAAIAALLMQANPGATPTQIYTAMRSSALAMGAGTPNFHSGYGFIQADAALTALASSASSSSSASNSSSSSSSSSSSGPTGNGVTGVSGGGGSGGGGSIGLLTLLALGSLAGWRLRGNARRAAAS